MDAPSMIPRRDSHTILQINVKQNQWFYSPSTQFHRCPAGEISGWKLHCKRYNWQRAPVCVCVTATTAECAANTDADDDDDDYVEKRLERIADRRARHAHARTISDLIWFRCAEAAIRCFSPVCSDLQRFLKCVRISTVETNEMSPPHELFRLKYGISIWMMTAKIKTNCLFGHYYRLLRQCRIEIFFLIWIADDGFGRADSFIKGIFYTIFGRIPLSRMATLHVNNTSPESLHK